MTVPADIAAKVIDPKAYADGSIFTAYRWLLEHTSMALASTYAYVNPVIALLLGWLWGGETLTPRSLVAALMVLTGVALIISTQRLKKTG